MPLKDGYKWEVTNFNKKGKEESKVTNTVSNVVSGDGIVSAVVNMVMTSGKDTHEQSYEMTCEGSTFKMSMDMFLPAEQMEQMQSMESMEVEMDMESMEFPSVLEVGQELKDAKMTMVAKTNGMTVMSMTTTITGRKVVSKETITTAAGTFECFKVEQTSKMNMGFVKKEFKSVSYLAEGVGVVRTENLNKKGEVDSYSEITQIF
jgi:hypothetical protein